MRKPLLPVALVLLVAFLTMSSAHATYASSPSTMVHPPPLGLAPNPNQSASSIPSANYDEQIGFTFTQSFSSMAYNVTAVVQTGSYGYGPAYLLNGLSDYGYWYQIGLSYDWPQQNGGYVAGFNVNYEVFDPSGTSVYPSNGGGGLVSLTGAVHNGDSVLLSLYFSGGDVRMYVYDWNTGAHASESYPAYGTYFVGLSSPANSNGFWTGLMTEEYHVNAYYGSELGVTYSNPDFALSSGYLWADEFSLQATSAMFSSNSYVVFQPPGLFQTFSTHGATASANAYTFVSGTQTTGALDLSYSVQGGGAGYSPPVLTYTYNGLAESAVLTTTPTIYYADVGTTWQVSAELSGGTSTQRWVVGGAPNGTVSSSTTEVLKYYHQALVTFAASPAPTQVAAGSLPFIDPTVQYHQAGDLLTATPGSPVWADVGSQYAFASPTVGSTSSERWASPSAAGDVPGSGTVTVTYYHQYSLVASYTIVGGGSPTPPTISVEQFGVSNNLQLSTRPSAVWLDGYTHWSVGDTLGGSTSQERWRSTSVASGFANGSSTANLTYYHQYAFALDYALTGGGSPTPPSVSGEQFGVAYTATLGSGSTAFLDSGTGWSVTNPLVGSSTTERWTTNQTSSGTVSAPETISFDYQHQYFFNASSGPSSGGTVANSTGWYDSGGRVQLSATAEPGWQFEGWVGSGSGSYSGQLNDTSIQVNGPMSETASFYPGLTITSGTDGSVSYSYGSRSGEVPAGTSATIYAPAGTSFSLDASPSFFIYKFSSWVPSSAGHSGETTTTLNSPVQVRADFALDLLLVGAITASLAAVAVALLAALMRKSRRTEGPGR